MNQLDTAEVRNDPLQNSGLQTMVTVCWVQKQGVLFTIRTDRVMGLKKGSVLQVGIG